MSPPRVVAFLSTGRCGTQWLTAGLRELHPEVVAEHEPIGPRYAPRRYFRRYEDPTAILAVPEVRRHLDDVQRESRPYVETGWPLLAALPLLAQRFADRLRVVHLTRHPVPTALSHLAHSSYAGSARDDAYTRLATLGPGDANVFQPAYAERWEWLSPYEKCLFWWTEVSLFGLEWSRRMAHIPFLRISAEAMLAGEPGALRRLIEFIGLGWDERWPERASTIVDRWHHHTDREVEPLRVLRHPATVGAARALGYDVAGLDLKALECRYRGRPDPGLDRSGRPA